MGFPVAGPAGSIPGLADCAPGEMGSDHASGRAGRRAGPRGSLPGAPGRIPSSRRVACDRGPRARRQPVGVVRRQSRPRPAGGGSDGGRLPARRRRLTATPGRATFRERGPACARRGASPVRRPGRAPAASASSRSRATSAAFSWASSVAAIPPAPSVAKSSGTTSVAPCWQLHDLVGRPGPRARWHGPSGSASAPCRSSGPRRPRAGYVLTTVPVPYVLTPTTRARPGVLEGAGEDLRRARGLVVDEDDERAGRAPSGVALSTSWGVSLPLRSTEQVDDAARRGTGWPSRPAR